MKNIFSTFYNFSVEANKSSDDLIAGVKSYKDIVKNLKVGVKALYFVPDISTFTKELKELNLDTSVINDLKSINQDSQSVLNSANVLVNSVKTMCEVVLKELANQKDRNTLNKAITKFLTTASRMETEILDIFWDGFTIKAFRKLSLVDSEIMLQKKEIERKCLFNDCSPTDRINQKTLEDGFNKAKQKIDEMIQDADKMDKTASTAFESIDGVNVNLFRLQF